ncbi:uncharacterized protein LOC135811691 [Sycon ciliatum]|uniref:uncharacterized protein LOC135811691 n=1 Tax=Sycon ciliatum TaxID=27933 RepID=UPI0031F6CEE7
MGIVGLLSALHVRQRDTQQLYFRYRRLSQKKTGDSMPAQGAENTICNVRRDGNVQRIQDSTRVGNEYLGASNLLPSVTGAGDFQDEDAYAKPLDTHQQGRSSPAVDEAQPKQVAVKASGEHTHGSDLAKRSTFMLGVTKTQQKSKSLPREDRISSFTYPEPPHKARTCYPLDGLVETLPEDPKDRMQDVVPYMSTSNSSLQVNHIGQVPEVDEDSDIYEAADDTDYEIYLNPDARGNCSPSSSCYMAMVSIYLGRNSPSCPRTYITAFITLNLPSAYYGRLRIRVVMNFSTVFINHRQTSFEHFESHALLLITVKVGQSTGNIIVNLSSSLSIFILGTRSESN